MNTHRLNTGMRTQAWAWLLSALVALALALGATSARAAAPALKTYASPEEAATALVQALKAGDRAAVRAALGDVTAWVWSGDAAADRAMVARFVTAYEAKHAVLRDGDVARLTIGADDFPFAFPLVRDGERWRFDPEAGKEEMLARRIGANELDTIKALQAIVDAQYEYASEDRDGDGLFEYAQKFASTAGKRDGLYWPVKAGEAASPLGELVVRAAGEGYRKGAKGPVPFHGYYFRMLKGQGSSAPSGAFDYVVRGNAIGGFAVIAHPAKYGNSGIMSFMVNQEGKIYQADLGPKTAETAGKIQRFDPGTGWSPTTIP
ncbi:MAG TPA: DUF2950 domain-containing protein [Quisquiliibacterium sp.]|nr:DUF2950 domain-containing protein [Quisquiliibacterium sp.]